MYSRSGEMKCQGCHCVTLVLTVPKLQIIHSEAMFNGLSYVIAKELHKTRTFVKKRTKTICLTPYRANHSMHRFTHEFLHSLTPAYTGMCRWTGYLWPLCPKQGI